MAEELLSVSLVGDLDIGASGFLAGELLGHRGRAVVLDASGVERLGGQCLQVLLSAAATWRRDGVCLSVAEPSTAFSEALGFAGVDVGDLTAAGSGAGLETAAQAGAAVAAGMLDMGSD